MLLSFLLHPAVVLTQLRCDRLPGIPDSQGLERDVQHPRHP